QLRRSQIGRTISGVGPEADPRGSEGAPIEQLARIDLAQRRHVGMAEHAPRRNGISFQDVARKIDQGRRLRSRERPITKFMAWIDEFYSDRDTVDVALACPVA